MKFLHRTLSSNSPARSVSTLRKPALLGLAIALGAPSLPALAQGAPAEARFVPGRLLVQPRPGLSDAEFEKILKPHGGKSVGKIDAINVHIVQLPPQASEKAVEALLKHNKHLAFAERDMLVKPGQTNDPYYGSAWHLAKIQAPSAWPVSTGKNVVVAILDSGVDAVHPDLSGRLVAGWNAYDGNSDSSDVYGHGTMVAGTVAAATNNGIGVAAVAGGALIMPVRVTRTDGWGSWSAIASGLTWAADRGARVANLSFYGVETSAAAVSAAQYMKSKGGLVVTSAGNYGVQESIAPNDAMITVSATDSGDSKTTWSSFGSFVDVAAPGAGIWTTTAGGGYGAVSGTSFSSPVTAGVVALMMAANSALPAAEIQNRLYASAADLGSAGFDTFFGHGRVDAAAAVQAALAGATVDSTAPSVTIASPGAGSTVKGLVAVDVNAADNVGVSRVDLLVNGVKQASDTSAPYGFSWDSAGVPDGNVSLSAQAFDTAGNYTTHAVIVKVVNVDPGSTQPPVDTTAPVATIDNPAAGSRVSGNLPISASATDDVGVSRLRLYIDSQLVASVAGDSLAYRWNTRKIADGAHTITVEAEDAAGNKGSRSVQVTK